MGIWLLVLAGAWLRCKPSRRLVIALLLLTFTPVLVLVADAYGNEGLLRVYLFSLPWAVALAAHALARPAPAPRDRDERAGHDALRAVVTLALAVTLFFPSFFGNDGADVMTPSEVNTVLAALLAGLAKSPYWTLVADNDGTEIYRLSPAARTMPAGSYSNNVILSVP